MACIFVSHVDPAAMSINAISMISCVFCVGMYLAYNLTIETLEVVMQIKSLTRTALALALLATSLSSCGSNPPATQALKDITIAQYGDLLIYLPLYIAEDQKFFEGEGVRPKFISGGGDDKTFAALAAGSAQFGVSDPTFTAIAREKGSKAVVVGTVVAGATYWGVTWNKQIGYAKTPAGLKNLRIATYEAPSTNYALMAKSLKQYSGQTGSARIVQGSYGNLISMVKAGQADVAMELEPAASTAVKEGARIVYSYPEMYGQFMLTGLYVMESYRDKDPKAVQGVVNALERAMRFAHANPAAAVAIARRKFPDVDPQVVDAAVKRMISSGTLPSHVTMDPKGWANTVNVRVELGDLKDRAVAGRTLDDSFSRKALSLK
jgi:NitT/TauT family transport system substrate-binding protein